MHRQRLPIEVCIDAHGVPHKKQVIVPAAQCDVPSQRSTCIPGAPAITHMVSGCNLEATSNPLHLAGGGAELVGAVSIDLPSQAC